MVASYSEHLPVLRAQREGGIGPRKNRGREGGPVHARPDSVHAKMRARSTLKNCMKRGQTDRQTDK